MHFQVERIKNTMGSQRIKFSIFFLIWASLICLSYSLPSEYSILGHDFESFPTEERVVELFQKWKLKERKAYSHVAEAELRFENFKRNLKYIVEKNNQKRSSSHKLGLNKFADMSNEEFGRVYLSKVRKPSEKRNLKGKRVESCSAPASLDWRKRGAVTGVKDQGDCGKFLFYFFSFSSRLLFY